MPDLKRLFRGMVIIEEINLKILFEGFPIAANGPVEGDNRLEYTAVVMGFMPMLLRQNNVAALVANQILVVRRNQQELAFAKPTRATIVGEVEVPTLPCESRCPAVPFPCGNR